MKTIACFGTAACAAAFVEVAAFTASAATIDMPGYAKGHLAPITQKSFEDLRDRTDQRIAEIRATPNMSSSSWGTRYVSAAGDDNNNGQSPEKPWKTLDMVNTNNDWFVSNVRFRRGDVFRGVLNAKSSVTYTAYGTGPKPCIYVSPKNGADPNKWEPTDVPNVWRYNAGKSDVGTIVFDGGRAHGIKIVPVMHTNGTTKTFTQQYTGLDFTHNYKDLAYDLHFWHDYTKSTRYWDYMKNAKGDGSLYLYSVENPGSRFKSIEFCVGKHAINVGLNSNVTIDNLCIKYCGAHGISAGSDEVATPVSNLKVTNCEFGWIGGSVQSEYPDKRNYPIRYGNAVEIYGGCNGYTVDNCYIYQVYDAAITQQFGLNKKVTQMDQKNMRYSNNVIECCNYSIEYFLTLGEQPSSNTSHMENFSIVSNIMWDAGTGFCEQRPILTEAAHIKSWTNGNRAKNYAVRDNAFVSSKAMLVQINSNLTNSDGSDSMPAPMSGNVFIGERGQSLGTVNQGTAVNLKYDDAGVSKLCERYADNYFLTAPKRKYSLLVTPPGPHIER